MAPKKKPTVEDEPAAVSGDEPVVDSAPEGPQGPEILEDTGEGRYCLILEFRLLIVGACLLNSLL
jgi:hypothetical protein